MTSKSIISKLKNLLTKRDKQFLFGLLIFSIIVSLIETVGISAIMPFIAIATDFDLIHTNEYYTLLYKFFAFNREANFIIAFGILLIFFYIFRSGINFLYFYLLSKFSQGRYHLLAYRLFENYMGLTYREFIKRNSSTLTKSIINEANNLTGLISAILLMMSEIFIIIFIYTMMLYVNYKITLLLTLILIINALLMVKTISVKIKRAGNKRAEVQKNFYEIVNRSFGNFKLIKLNSNDDKMLNEFRVSSFEYARVNIINSTLLQLPRLLLEAIAFSIIVFIITYLVYEYEDDISGSLAIISIFVLALYRLMPSVNRIMNSYNTIMFHYKSLDIIHSDLMYDSENLGNKNIEFKKEIVLKNVSFEYEENKLILDNINLTIKKGEKIAFIGESGSGKSTLVDLIIGLYKPKNGILSIDDKILNDNCVKSWRTKIGYIPQSVYLFDGNVAENIAFGSTVDEAKVIQVLEQANIYEFLKSKDGIKTKVGEGGIMLSGGQKQRVAIARALYNNPEILVLDEATSALDNETEEKIMDEIYKISSDKTLIIIAHRLSTINRCEKVYKLENGKIVNG